MLVVHKGIFHYMWTNGEAQTKKQSIYLDVYDLSRHNETTPTPTAFSSEYFLPK